MNVTVREIDVRSSGAESKYRLETAANQVLKRARMAAYDIGYAGDIVPEQAWALFSEGIAELVDVRTFEELQCVGCVPSARHVEWIKGRDRQKNTRFLSELNEIAGKEDVLLFLCRSGIRSVAAAQAATQAGFPNAFNVLEGFEGDGSFQQGWLKRGLPTVLMQERLKRNI